MAMLQRPSTSPAAPGVLSHTGSASLGGSRKGSLAGSRRGSKVRRSSTGFRSRERFSAAAQRDLLETVDGILEKTMPIKAATAHLARLERQADEGVPTVAPEAITSAVEILTECLQRRLREAAETAILAGQNHLTKDGIDDVHRALENVKESGFLDDQLDLNDFERFSRNLDSKFLATKVVDPRDPTQAVKLTGLLHRHLQAPEADLHIMLTDATLAEVTQTILWMMVMSQKACDAVIKQGIVDVAAKMVLGPPNEHDAKEHPMAVIPELQGRLCQILAGVVVRACEDEEKSKRSAKAVSVFGGGGRRSLLGGLGGLGGGSPNSAEGDKALSFLLRIMKEKMECNDHSGVWSAVKALHIVAKRSTGAKKILMAEGLLMIQKASGYYRSLRHLPPATGKKPPEGPRISYEKPSFVDFPTAPALLRKPAGVMETLRKEESLANPRRIKRKKTLLDVGDQTNDNGNASLLGKEVEIDPLACLRVADRNILVLKLHYLERAVKSAGAELTRPFARRPGSAP